MVVAPGAEWVQLPSAVWAPRCGQIFEGDEVAKGAVPISRRRHKINQDSPEPPRLS